MDPSANYTFHDVKTSIAISYLVDLEIRWISTSGFPNEISLKSVTIIPAYENEPYRSQATKIFCAAKSDEYRFCSWDYRSLDVC